MGNSRLERRVVIIRCCGVISRERMLLMLVKLYLEDRGGRVD